MDKKIIERLKKDYPERTFEIIDVDGNYGIKVDGNKTLKFKFDDNIATVLEDLHGISIKDEILNVISREVRKELKNDT